MKTNFIFIFSGPYTEYKIIVTAFTKKHDGEACEVIQRTDISGPSAPKILSLTCQSHDSLFFAWKRPETYYNSIDYYIISFRNLGLHSFREIELTANASILETSVSPEKTQPHC
jgi:receptor-type tyrosine-protein phosphatase gamma